MVLVVSPIMGSVQDGMIALTELMHRVSSTPLLALFPDMIKIGPGSHDLGVQIDCQLTGSESSMGGSGSRRTYGSMRMSCRGRVIVSFETSEYTYGLIYQTRKQRLIASKRIEIVIDRS